MTNRMAKEFLGCQIWLEPADSAERVDLLFRRAAESGLGWARIFLMWPWLEPAPGEWHFDLFDHAFASAARHGLQIKATLTANSGPWHIGTPSMLHSHTGFLDASQRAPMQRYVTACVRRYAHHPALGQWILWNEPNGGGDRTAETLARWRTWLAGYYEHDISRLNRRWRTGYAEFSEAPFPEDLPHPAHHNQFWNSYGPWLADWQHRASWLVAELAWLKELVRALDSTTPCCVNPTEVLSNQAQGGTDLGAMARIVEVLGASYHPAWHFTFADRRLFPALMSAGVTLEASIPTVQRVEVTEVQSGNTLNSSSRPSGLSPGELARFYLSGLAAGAESVTGWCLNVRSQDFEAGDWGLLDNMDGHSERSHMLRRIHDCLDSACVQTGAWLAGAPRAWVGYSPGAQALEWVEAQGVPVPGRLAADGAHGAALLACELMQAGVPTALARLADLPAHARQPGDVIVLSHVVAWEESDAERLLRFAESGGVLVVDATSGRKTTDAVLHRPWPGGLGERIGLYVTDLSSRPEGYQLTVHGLPAGRALLTRTVLALAPDAGWEAWPEVRFAYDGEPCVLERAWGEGRIVFVRALMGPSLVHAPDSAAAVRYVLAQAARCAFHPLRPAPGQPAAFVVPVQVEHGQLTAVFAPDALDRQGQALRILAPAGDYLDLWTGHAVRRDAHQELALPATEGIALLWSAG
jgi:hypothetical protein